MRVVLDTNIFVSALVSSGGPPDLVYRAWLVQRFDLLTCHRQVEELRETLHKPFFSGRLHPHVIGRLINDLQDMAIGIDPLPRVVRSSDPDDDFLLALAQAGRADYLVSGDKSGLLALRKHAGASIVTARAFVDRLS
ncbi:putative toxin-antitoxin system toxin component, PIN family [Terriglobus sp.]|uniref:putative toxin-antitoxin system toxin component, PIN family n=1 Tax=Terriglobus sp. TaxID=1889013 RepID=UPI003B00B408